ncbi:type IV toxin-antitoxin system AbiEi family antitoxin domain-containing protein [Cellulomonas bogoriensis]|uniref:AbiEi antitoxin N-terminal domain-containing protein n=1 Tax=Cellulomonas bogoriensis 69B4 = DSM 16987 TaxID=1386082 RepID=A0A0A0BN82_9CELL|nr:type IV toxin-antitoxin system AbiEi family antitoxin domain-containing protein [Cellulomonas bogoriensis]KGM09421.1 hypothetical protein N869_06750 [Cellulomonas bogoriensis 69B4 = DSM 16987]
MRELPAGLVRLVARQHGVVTTAQCVAHGVDRVRVHRLVRSGWWRRLHPGVHVTYTGELSWRTRAAAALLHAGAGAALSHESAAVLHGFTSRLPRVITVVVPWERHPVARPGMVVRRRRRAIRTTVRELPVTDQPTTVLDLVARSRSDDDALGWVSAAVRAGTRPADLRRLAAAQSRVGRRRLLGEVLDLVEEGAESPLEARYHRDVERRHGLPRSARQGWEQLADGWIRSDCRYVGRGVRVELDGQLGHPGGRTSTDTWRDNAVALTHDEVTLRYRWDHVAVHPCRTAQQVAAALHRRGWTGTPRACSPGCAVR